MAENLAKHEAEHDHREQRLQKRPKQAQHRVPILELNIFVDQFPEQKTIFPKIFNILFTRGPTWIARRWGCRCDCRHS